MQADPSPPTIEMTLVESRVFERLFGHTRGAVTIGRFPVLGMAGAGGMGVVFVAHDRELDRKIAIKLVAIGRGGSTASSQTRLLAEAQTLARLSHPNIVTVHEVGTHEGGIYVAMEYIEGDTLERWLARGPGPAEILAAFVQAGRGLAAAHEAGIVHRDFKPTNAMIDRAGRVRVVDFGLAVEDGDDLEVTSETSDHGLRTIGGTPLFMAPEYQAGAKASPRTDLYAFCISLWTALTGEHPFAADDLDGTVLAMERGTTRSVPSNAMPPWLRRVLQKGLAADPEARWASMAELLGAIDRARMRARRRRAIAWGGGVVALAMLVLGARELHERRETAACERDGATIDEVWNDDVRAQVLDAVAKSEATFAVDTAERAMPWIDRKVESLRTVRTEACMHARVRDDWSPDTFERAQWCLIGHRVELAELVGELRTGHGPIVQNAVTVASAISPADPCLDEHLLATRPAPPVADRSRLVELRLALGRVTVVEKSGRFQEALTQLEPVLEQTRAIGWQPLITAARLRHGSVLNRLAHHEEAEQALAEAYFEAARAGSWDAAENAASMLIFVTGAQRARLTDALMWSRHSEIAAAHAGDPDARREAVRLNVLGLAHAVAGKPLEARELHERALALRERSFGPEHPTVGAELCFLAQTYETTDDLAKATELLERALAIQEASLGPFDPLVGQTLQNIGSIYDELGRTAEARVAIERSLEIMRTRGHEAAAAVVMVTLASILGHEGDIAGKRALLEQSIALHERTLGPDSFELGTALFNLATLEEDGGRLPEARALYERLVRIEETALGAEHPSTAGSRAALAAVLLRMGEHARALQMLERSVGTFDAQRGLQEHESLARFDLAKAIVATDGDRDRARAQAEAARAGYFAIDGADSTRLPEIDAWLAAHARSG
jgi:tetratricopeptide (TPR) repeat protein